MTTTESNATPPPTWSERFKRWLDVGTMLKTAFGLAIGAAVAVYGVYQHFAKAAELRALTAQQIADVRKLSCDLAEQAYLNSRLVEVSRNIRVALSELKTVRTLDELPHTINEAVIHVDNVLEQVTTERDRILSKKMIVGGPQCGS